MDSHGEALRSMTGWIAAIADNVRNPIAGIGAALAIAEQQLEQRASDPDWTPATLEQSFALIRARLGTLTEYVNELVDFAKPIALNRDHLDVTRLLTAACNAVDGPDRYGVAFEVDVAPGTPALFADGPKIHRALLAMLVNAVEAMGGVAAPRARVFARPGPTPGAVEIGVEDSGRGMSAEGRARATEPFFSTKEAGTGLGLTLAERLVKTHGGQLTIDHSAALGGCRITLRFPPAPAPAHHASEAPR